MIIGENLHIISKKTREAIENRDIDFVLENVKKQVENGVKIIDLNVGPAKKKLEGSLCWLIDTISKNYDVDFSLDTTNIQEMSAGFGALKNPQNAFFNSTNADSEKLNNALEIVNQYNCNLIALTMQQGNAIAQTPDERLEIAMEINAQTQNSGLDNSKLYFDPLVLPVCAAQEQALVALETIRMLKMSFDPEVKTVIGLSNISNGSPAELRPFINQVFFVMAKACGLDCAIADSFDKRLLELNELLKTQKCSTEQDEIYIKLYQTIKDFGEIEDINYNKDSTHDKNVIKCANILLNKEIYSHSFIS